jgi:hypothetical protein
MLNLTFDTLNIMVNLGAFGVINKCGRVGPPQLPYSLLACSVL